MQFSFSARALERRPSLTLRARVAHAAELYTAQRAPVILCSGGYSRGRSEATVMRELLVAHGVPHHAVIPDDGGTSTRLALRSARRFGRGRWQTIIAVSSPYHLRRICAEAKRQGLIVTMSAARSDEPMTQRRARFLARQRMREAIATTAYAAGAGVERLRTAVGGTLPARAVTQVTARLDFLLKGADDVAASSERLGQIIKSKVADFSDTSTVETPASGLEWPAAGAIGGTFGMRFGRLHAGIDIRAPYGAPVLAAGHGTV